MGIVQYAYETVRHVSNYIDNNSVDFIYQAGDYGYGDDRDPMYYEVSWDLFFTQMQLAMTSIPYMAAVGNHEHSCGSDTCDFYANNFTVYNNRFNMPAAESGAVNNLWYSFNYGNVHFISISTETDFPNWFVFYLFYSIILDVNFICFSPYPSSTFGNQIAWLQNDLDIATNDSNIDWIIAVGHQPIYSSVSSKSTVFGVPKGDSRVKFYLIFIFLKFCIKILYFRMFNKLLKIFFIIIK